jgi:chromosome segregation protein
LFVLVQDIKSLKKTIAGIEEKITPLQNRRDQTRSLKQELEIRLHETAQVFAQLTRESDSLEKELSFAKNESGTIHARIDILIQEKDLMTGEEQRIEQEKEQLETSIQNLGREEESLRTKVKSTEEELEKLQAESEQKRQQYFELRSGLDVLQERTRNLERRIQDSEIREQAIHKKIQESEQEIDRSEKEKSGLKKKVHNMGDQLRKINVEIASRENNLNQEESTFHQLQQHQSAQEKKLESLREKHENAKEERIKWEIKKAEKERDLVNCEESCWQELKKSIDEIKKEVEINESATPGIEKDLETAQDKLQRIGSVNLMAEEEYQSQKERYDFLMEQKQDLIDSIASTKEAIRKIDQESRTQFLKALTAVNQNFQDIFAILFEGGSAQIKLSDEDDPLESGIEVIAQPPGKRVQNLALLSGGEKTLTSLAFFFALFRYKPAPFCILDEVDAALDENNLERFLNLMKKIKHRTQFIIVTHNFKTMEVADYIYGTTMPEPNITSMYSVKLKNGKAVKES